MATNLFGSICLTDIPKERIRTSEKNGKKYLTICINEKKEADQYGNTHYIKVYNPDKDAKPVYLGDLKLSQLSSSTQQANVQPSAEKAAEAESEKNNDDLPF